MAYGFEIKNKFGADILSTQGMLFVRSGYPQSMAYPVATPGNDSYAMGILDAAGLFGLEIDSKVTAWALSGTTTTNQSTGFSWGAGSFGYNGLLTQVTSSSTTSRNYNGVNYRMPHAAPDTQDGADFMFFELPSAGLHWFQSIYQPYDYAFAIQSKGLIGMAVPSSSIGSGNFLKYIVTTSQKPSVTGDHGLQTFDASGNVIYDSRYLEQPFRVREVVKITRAQLENCVNNGTTYTFPLRNSFVSPYVGGSFAPAGRMIGGGAVQYPTLSMANSSTLRLSRQQYKGSAVSSSLSEASKAWDSYIIMTDLGI
jgi:hypothetical protein